MKYVLFWSHVLAFRVLLLFVGSALAAHAQTSTWTAGSGSNFNWSDSTNWDGGEPLLTHAVIFPTIPNPGGLPAPETVLLSAGELAQSLTFNASGYLLSGGSLALATPGNITVTTAGHLARINSLLTGTSGLTKLGAGNLTLGGANDFTGTTRVLDGILTLASGGSIGVAAASAGSLQIGENGTASLIVESGGNLRVGSGAGDHLYVGSRTAAGTANTPTRGTLDLSLASTFTADVGQFYVGVSVPTTTPGTSATTVGEVMLAQTSNSITAAAGVIVADSYPSGINNTPITSTLTLGSGTNSFVTPSFLVGGRKSTGMVTFGSNTGGTFTLGNGAGKTDLYIGRNFITSTGTNASGTMNLSGGTFIGTLGVVVIGERSNDAGTSGTTSNVGYGTGVLTLSAGANQVTADSLVLGNLLSSPSSTNITQGTLNMAGGTFTVAGDVGLGIHTATGGLSRGTLNLTGGSFSVGGNITKAAKTTSTAVIIINGATLDMTGGSIAASQLAWRNGSISNLISVDLDANSGTTGTGETGDALIFGDFDLNFGITLSGASGGHVHYEAGTSSAGATISGDVALGTVARTFNIENNANAAIDTTVTGLISGTGGITKTGTGTLRLNNANTHSGATTLSDGQLILNNTLALQNSTFTLNTAGGLEFAAGIADFTFGGLAGNATGSLTLDDAAAQAVNLTVGGNNASTTFSGTLSGDGTLTKTGTGTTTLAGTSANTYTGLTTVNNGTLTLNKSSGVNAIIGNISLINGGDLRFGTNTGQVATTTQITINGGQSTFNGTGSNTGVITINETFASLTVLRGVVNAGFVTSQLTVTGASSFSGNDGTTKDTSTMYIGNSGSSFTTGSLSLTDMTGAGGTENANSFTVFGNNDTVQTLLHIGAGGLTLNTSNLHLNKGSNANTLGSRLILDGDITVNGSAASAIISTGNLGQSEVELSSTSAPVTRTITTHADLSINADLNNGAATIANLTKTGAGVLTLIGLNSYTGHTQINAGTLSINSSASLGDESLTNTLGLASGTTLQYTSAGIADLTANRDITLGTGIATFEITQASGNLILSGDLTGVGTGALTKTGAGRLTLAGANLSGLNNRGLDLAEGGLSFVNNVGMALDLGSGSLHLADQTALYLEIGSLAAFDSITTSAVATVESNATIQLITSALSGITSNTTYNLITAGAGSGFDAAGLTWNLSLSGSYKYQLNTTDTLVQLQTLDAVTGDAYWRGDVGGSWSTVIIGPTNNTNWATDLTGTTDREATPGPATSVYFSTANATGPSITTTLDNDFTINDLAFLASPGGVTDVTIAQGAFGTLTLTPTDTADGVAVQDNAGAIAISAPVQLGAAQTWNVSDTGASLAVSGVISGSDASSLTKTGTGTLTLSGVNTYTGRTLINGGIIAINAENRLGANPSSITVDQLTLNGGTLQSTANFAIDDVNRGITLGASGGTFNTNNGTTLTVSSVIAGSGSLTKSGGTGTLVLTRANTYTGNTTVLTGTLRIASGSSIGVASATAGSLQVSNRSTATLIVDAGGDLEVGSGAASTLYVGTRTDDSSTTATVGTLNLSAASNFTADVGRFYIGVADTASASGNTRGLVTLAQNNTITASTEILVGQMTPALANQNVISELNFGSGINNITTPSLTIGGRKSAATSTIAAGGVLNLANGVGKTNLYIGRNNNSGTSTHASGSLDLSNGTFNATLGTVVIGERSDNNGGTVDGSGAGSGTGTLTLGPSANSITADSVMIGNLLARGTTTVTQGTLNMAGGTFTVSGDVGIGIHNSSVAAALSQGLLNLTGGTFTVGGNIITTNKTTSTSIVTLDGGTLDMTAGSINVDSFNARSGTLKDVSQIFNGSGTLAAELNKTTTGALILSGSNTYTGATTVTAGTLEVQGTSGTGLTTVKTTGTLAGAGLIQSTTGTVVESGGTLTPGNNLGEAIGTLSFDSFLELQSGSTTVFQLSGPTGTVADPFVIDSPLLNGTPGNHDHLDITGSLTLSTLSTLEIRLFGYNAGYGDVFNLIDWTTLGNATANGFNHETDFDFSDAALDFGLTWETDRFLADGILYITPEPSRTLLLLSGLLLCLSRRRR